MAISGTLPLFASNILTSDATVPTANDTVTIGGKVYTFKAGPTTVDGEVKLTTTAAGALQNLYNAINLEGTPGTDYGSGTVINPYVKATAVTATTLTVKSRTPGAVGNLIACLATSTHLDDWTAAACAGGAGHVDTFLTNLEALNSINAEVLSEIHKLTLAAD